MKHSLIRSSFRRGQHTQHMYNTRVSKSAVIYVPWFTHSRPMTHWTMGVVCVSDHGPILIHLFIDCASIFKPTPFRCRSTQSPHTLLRLPNYHFSPMLLLCFCRRSSLPKMSFIHGVQHGYIFKSNSVKTLIHYKIHGLNHHVPIIRLPKCLIFLTSLPLCL